MKRLVALSIGLCAAAGALAQTVDSGIDAVAPSNSEVQPGNWSFGTMGVPLVGPIDVQINLPSGDLQILGVEWAWGHFFSTGRNGGAGLQRIYWSNIDGTYVSSIAQTTASPSWGHRDLASDEDRNLLFAGSDGGEFTVYRWTGTTLQFVSQVTVPNTTTIRALARNPNTGNFYTADFNNPIHEFTEAGQYVRQYPNPGRAFYGMAWDCQADTLWGWSQNGTPAVQAFEMDPANNMALTGRGFQGININPAQSVIAGGADIDTLPDHPNRLRFIGMHQVDGTTRPQEGIVIYGIDEEACGGCPFDPCDTNCDGTVDAFDIEPFIGILTGVIPNPCSPCAGDADGNGVVDAFDIEPFINCLTGP